MLSSLRKLPSKIEGWWDALDAHRRRHVRKYTALGILLVIVPTEEIGPFLWASRPRFGSMTGFLGAMSFELPDASVWSVLRWVVGGVLIGAFIRDWVKSRTLPGSSAFQSDEDGYIQLEDDIDSPPEAEQLRHSLRHALNERDGALQGLATCKTAFAKAALSWIAQRANLVAELRGREPNFRVTIKFADHKDFALVENIRRIIKECLDWPVTLEQQTSPALEPAKDFKVLFDSPITTNFESIAANFESGRLLGDITVGIYRKDERDDPDHLVIKVLPTA